jgi:hypothetical protein
MMTLVPKLLGKFRARDAEEAIIKLCEIQTLGPFL